MVRSPRARNKITELPHRTSLLGVRASLPEGGDIAIRDDLRLFSSESALIACSPVILRAIRPMFAPFS